MEPDRDFPSVNLEETGPDEYSYAWRHGDHSLEAVVWLYSTNPDQWVAVCHEPAAASYGTSPEHVADTIMEAVAMKLNHAP